MTQSLEAPLARQDNIDNLVTVLDLVRYGHAATRPELARQSGLGRAIITQQVDRLIALELLRDGELAPSTGGRAPRTLAFRAGAGVLLVGEFGASSMAAALSDLSGNLLVQHRLAFDIASGPEIALRRLSDVFQSLLDKSGVDQQHLWGAGVGVPGPVEFSTGRPMSPPIMPGWDAYPIRETLSQRFDVPVWVDNEVNTMALGELRSGLAQGEEHVIYLKIGTGIGAGIISEGHLHRGAQGCAGDVGHVAVQEDSETICRCGNRGCLEALAGGAALARDGALAAKAGTSPYLATLAVEGHEITGEDISAGAQRGDAVCLQLLQRCGRLVGDVLATLVNFHNPGLILVGGGVAAAGDVLLAAIRETIYRRSLPLATRDLRIVFSPLGDDAGLRGAATMVSDELFARHRLGRWIESGSPAGMPEIAAS